MKNDRRSSGRRGVMRLIRDRCGAAAPLFAVMLTMLFGFAGLGVDVGIWYTLKRQYQSAADIAALSGALEVAAGNGTASVTCQTGSTTTDLQCQALYAAQDNMTSGSAGQLKVVTTSCTTPAANQLCVNSPPQL